jgi:hypothetical protein
MQLRNPECLLLPEHLLLLVELAIPLGFERPVFSGHLLLRLPCPYATPPCLFPVFYSSHIGDKFGRNELHTAPAPPQPRLRVLACPCLELAPADRTDLHRLGQAHALVPKLEVSAARLVDHRVRRGSPADHVAAQVALSPREELAVGVWVVGVVEVPACHASSSSNHIHSIVFQHVENDLVVGP